MKKRTVDACELQPYSAAMDFLWAWPPADRDVCLKMCLHLSVCMCVVSLGWTCLQRDVTLHPGARGSIVGNCVCTEIKLAQHKFRC